jgi:ElaB/YqjD/DUF883 family membrane-anchored ribosome-binding protein
MSRINEPGSGSGQQSGGGSAAGGTVSQLRDKAASMAGNIRDAATEQYEHLRDTASEYYDQGRRKAQEWQQGLEEYVQEQPIKSLLIAAGVGMLLGILWKRS